MPISRLVSAQTQPESACATLESTADSNNQLALRLYQKLRATEGNLFFSPYCIFTPLALISAGARGMTAAEIARVLRVPAIGEQWHTQVATLGDFVMAGGKQGAYELHIANRLWAQRGFPLLPAFLQLIAQYYESGVHEVDFSGGETTRVLINEWVEAQTAGKITELIPTGMISPLTRAILTTAIYFNGFWLSPFQPDLTWDRDFWLSPSVKIDTPMMFQKDDFFYVRHDEAQVIELPYKGQATNGRPDISMFILLPHSVDGLDEVGAHLTLDKLNKWLSELAREGVTLSLPRFRILSTCWLAQILGELGMPSAFRPDTADFSGMVHTTEPFWIDTVLHQARVNVDEQGTEAAAATGVDLCLGSSPRMKVFHVNRPFIFLIRHNPSRSILFMGHVRNPKA